MSAEKRKGGRRATGTIVRTKRGLLQAVITLVDGTRKRLPPFPKGTSDAMAREKANHFAEEAVRRGLRAPTPAGATPPEGGGAWWEAYLAHREARGLSPVLHIYRTHIKPVLGDKHPRDWTREDCERLVTALDAKITSTDKDRVSWKTAANAWSLFTRACTVASSAKAGAGLRVRSDNPCAGVEGPDRGEKKAKQWLYPDEFSMLVACGTVPLRWRRLYTLLAYTYVRPGELRALTWADVNRKVGTIHVTKAWDEKRARLKPPKTRAGVRYLPIEAELEPLLTELEIETGGTGLVVPNMPPMEDWAEKFRRHLARAGVTRAELFADTETHKQITLYDLRATGITWRCLRKDHGPEIQEAAGHEKYDTTDGYIRTARVFGGRVGTPFPPLPPSLLSSNRSQNRSLESQVLDIFATPAGIEPALPA